ncbi:protein Vms1p [[Candida] railenensis]|uniref:Protein Vms1p n=1 Tax=[Candida] railenensis TaxID=45579 RepID=A0A9P0VXI0_9ASCO|nr:protein Vms1p [[Candida] railenensis]
MSLAKGKDLAPESLYLFNLQPKISDSLELIYFDSSITEVSAEQVPSRSISPAPAPAKPLDGSSSVCTVCKIGPFGNLDERKAHYKTDLHRFNLKRSLQNQEPLSEEAFDKLVEEQSIESLSGSESEDDDDEDEDKDNDGTRNLDNIMEKLNVRDSHDSDENTVSHLNTKSAYVYFKSPSILGQDSAKVFGVYKCLFSPEQLLNVPVETLHNFSKEPIKSKKSAMFMLGGGHFAGAIVSHVAKNTRGNPINTKETTKQEQAVNILVSKTFHRYTTRRKQGGAQSASDNARGKANSAGSTIRRYNEQALIQEIRELLRSWRNELSGCEFIFIRANGPAQRKILIGYEGCELNTDDPRLRTFPFTTKRATASELKRAWAELSYLKVLDIPKEDSKLKKKLQQQKEQIKNSIIQKKQAKVELSPEELHSTELINLLKKSKAPLLINYIKKNNLSPNMSLEPKSQHIHAPTLLHYASSHGLSHMVQILLINLKADPLLKNDSHRSAVELAANPTTRKAFQIARNSLGEDYCDWDTAKVGPPKTKDEIQQEEKEEQEQISKEKKRLIEVELAKKTELELKIPRISGGGVLGGSNGNVSMNANLSGLSDQQKMRLMREQRARAAEARFKSPS